MEWSVSQLSESQKELFDQFAEKVKDCDTTPSTDDFLLKWLVAREFNVEEAEKMFLKSLEWRRLNKIDDMVDTWTPPEVLPKYYPIGRTGYDKTGAPLWILRVGKFDIKGMFQCITKKDYMMYCMIYLTENSRRQMKRRNEEMNSNVTYQTFIGDMSDVSMRDMYYKPYLDAGMESTKIMEANYPENLRRLFVINAPRLFTLLFNMVKPMLSQATIEKFRIYGCNQEEWKAALLEDIDADQLPVAYGGTLTDPDGDPECPSKITIGGTIPTSYYRSNVKLVPTENMQSATVLSSNRKKIKYEVTEPFSSLKWKFFTEGGDIAFRVYHKKADGEKVEMFPKDRLECHLIMEEGSTPCDEAGTYVAEFDNSYSYFRSKKLWYCFTIEKTASIENFDNVLLDS